MKRFSDEYWSDLDSSFIKNKKAGFNFGFMILGSIIYIFLSLGILSFNQNEDELDFSNNIQEFNK